MKPLIHYFSKSSNKNHNRLAILSAFEPLIKSTSNSNPINPQRTINEPMKEIDNEQIKSDIDVGQLNSQLIYVAEKEVMLEDIINSDASLEEL